MSSPDLEAVIASNRHLRPETKSLYRSAVRSFVVFASGRTYTGALVEMWCDVMAEGGAAASTINTRLAAVKSCSRRLAALGLGPDFAAGAQVVPASGEKTRRPLTIDQCKVLLSACDDGTPRGLRDRVIFLLGLKTGIRVGGMTLLEGGHVEPSGMIVTLKGGRVIKTPPLDPQLVAAVHAWTKWLQPNKTERLLRGLRKDTADCYITTDAMGARAIRDAVAARARDAGLRHVHPHLFRHTFVSMARAAGWPDWQISLYTGHRLIPTERGDGASPMLSVYTGDLATEAPRLPPL